MATDWKPFIIITIIVLVVLIGWTVVSDQLERGSQKLGQPQEPVVLIDEGFILEALKF